MTGGEEALAEIGLEVGPAGAADAGLERARRRRRRWRRRAAARARRGGRRQARRHPDPGAPPRRRDRRSRPAASTTSPTRLPEVVEVARSLPGGDLVLDGEAIALDDDGRPRPFQETASRTAQTSAGSGVAVTPYFFDVLHADGRDLLDATGTERLEVLDTIVPEEHRVPRLVTDDPDAAEAVRPGRARARPRRRGRQEPLDRVRRRSSRLRVGQGEAGAHPRPGRARGRVGQRPPPGLAVQHPPRRAQPSDGTLHDARQDLQGDDRRDARLADRALHRARARAGDDPRRATSYPLRPEQVVEIAFDGLQRSTRYPGGLALRFARVVRYRDDKSADEADTHRDRAASLGLPGRFRRRDRADPGPGDGAGARRRHAAGAAADGAGLGQEAGRGSPLRQQHAPTSTSTPRRSSTPATSCSTSRSSTTSRPATDPSSTSATTSAAAARATTSRSPSTSRRSTRASTRSCSWSAATRATAWTSSTTPTAASSTSTTSSSPASRSPRACRAPAS